MLTFETRGPSHETEINPIEEKKNKKITIRKILMDEIEKKDVIINIKKNNNKKNEDQI